MAGEIEVRPLPPIDSEDAPTIPDREQVIDAVRDALQDMVSGSGSYFPDGGPKHPDVIRKDLENFVKKLDAFQNTVNDPTAGLYDAVRGAKSFLDAYKDYVNEFNQEPPGGPVIIPPAVDPHMEKPIDPPPTDPPPTNPPSNPPTNPPVAWPPAPPAPPRDPLVLDLDGDGVELRSLDQSQAHFDYGSDGFAEKTGWLHSDDAFLVHDDNNNGSVDGITELFGSPVQDGFSALRVFDTNSDGRIDASDENFSTVKLWRDLDGDGVFDAGEIFTLREFNIASIDLGATPSGRLNAGNEIALEGIFTRTDGSTGKAEAVLFNTHPVISRWDMPEGFVLSPDAGLLPDLKGYGLLPDLAYSMTLDTNLLEMVETYVLESLTLPADQIRSRFSTILMSWANVAGISENARGSNIDGKVVAFLEKYFGSGFVGEPDGTIGSRYAEVIQASYDTIVDVLLSRFLAQTTSAAVKLGAPLDQIIKGPALIYAFLDYDVASDTFRNDVDDIIDWVIDLSPSTTGQKVEYYSKAFVALAGLKYEYFGNDTLKFKDYLLGKIGAAESGQIGLIAFIERLAEVGKLIGGSGQADTLNGTSGNDLFVAGRGDDILTGENGNDMFVYSRGDGNDTISEAFYQGSADKLLLVDLNPSDVRLTRDGTDVILQILESSSGAGDGGSILLKAELDLDIWKTTGVEQILFANGTIWKNTDLAALILSSASTSGNDSIIGFNTNDVIAGGAGNDTVDGAEGNDTYIYHRGDGNDTIIEAFYSGSADKLQLPDIIPSDVRLTRNGTDVTLQILETSPGAGDGGSILLKSELDLDIWDTTGVEQIVFADGTIWARLDLAAMLLRSTDADDTLIGFNSNDVIEGGLGNDTLDGGSGNDTFVYSRGDGNDTITEAFYKGSADKLLLVDLNPSDVRLTRNGTDVTLQILESSPSVGDGGSILLKAELDFDIWKTTGVEQILFADGTIWNKADFASILLATANGATTLLGSELADSLVGSAESDLIVGGGGNDIVNGGWGADTYLYRVGDGHDIIEDWNNPESKDIVSLGDGINANAATVERGTTGFWDIVLGFGTAGSVTIRNGFHADSSVIEEVRFHTGIVWNLSDLRQRFLAQALTSGDDEIYGFLDTDDIINGGDGADSLDGFSGNDILSGDAGDDTLVGEEGNDRLIGGVGADSLFGNSGSDIYAYESGDGNDYLNDEDSDSNAVDVLQLTDLNQTQVEFMRSGTSLIMTVIATGQTIFINNQFSQQDGGYWGIEKIEFAGGSSWNLTQINDIGWMRGTSGDDSLTGTWRQEILSGGTGNDNLNGDWGADTYIFSVGDGHDTIQDWDNPEATDVLQLGSGISTAMVAVERGTAGFWDMVLDFGTAGSVTVTNGFYSASTVIEEIRFADQTVWMLNHLQNLHLQQSATSAGDTISGFTDRNDTINGAAGNDSLTGFSGNDLLLGGIGDDSLSGDEGADTLDGGAGDDGLTGGAGSDVFVFKSGFGFDWVQDFTAGAGTDDVIEISNSLFADFQAILAAASQEGINTVIAMDANNTITLHDVMLSNLHADDFRFVA